MGIDWFQLYFTYVLQLKVHRAINKSGHTELPKSFHSIFVIVIVVVIAGVTTFFVWTISK